MILNALLKKIILMLFDYFEKFLECKTKKIILNELLKKKILMSFGCFENFLECRTKK